MALSFGIAGLFIALHLENLGLHPLDFMRDTYPWAGSSPVTEVVITAAGVFVCFSLLGIFLTLAWVFRYSPTPLPWTYLDENQY